MKNLHFINIIILALFVSSCSTNYLTTNLNQTSGNELPRKELFKIKNALKKPIFQDISNDILTVDVDILKEFDNTYTNLVNQSFNRIYSTAKTYIGTPYRYGGTNRRGIDCSSFMQHIYKAEGIILPRVSYNQAKIGVAVLRKDIQKGDLIFFSTTSKYRVTHVGMVTRVSNDDVQFIHSASSKGVSFSKLSNPYWNKRYRGARRPHKLNDLTLVKVGNVDSLTSI